MCAWPPASKWLSGLESAAGMGLQGRNVSVASYEASGGQRPAATSQRRRPSMTFRFRASTVAATPGAWRRIVAALIACALTLAGPGSWTAARAQSELPALGDTDSADFTVGTERKIGDDIMREIRVDPDYLDDPLLLEYVEIDLAAARRRRRARSATSRPTSTSASPGSRSWSATRASTRSRCRAASSACTSA